MAKILIGYSACPLTRAAFEAHGHDVWTCDRLPARGENPKHFQCDIWQVADMPGWDFGLFHPMCTVLTTSSAWAFFDADFDRYPSVGYHQKVKPETLTGKARRDQRELEIENFRRLLKLPYQKAIENPAVSFLNTAIRPPTQVIHPHQHGDDASKATGLWLADADGWESQDMPRIVATSKVEPRWRPGKRGMLPRWGNQTDSGQNRESPGADRWLKRSKTYPGIAAALGGQWGSWLNWKDAPRGATHFRVGGIVGDQTKWPWRAKSGDKWFRWYGGEWLFLLDCEDEKLYLAKPIFKLKVN